MQTTCSLVLGLLLTTALLPAQAGQQRVYQWKDANGVTHYTDTPPAGKYTTRDIDADTGAIVEPKPENNKESQQCMNARANLLRLQSSDEVGVDEDGDGKSDRNLSQSERKAQTDLNQATINAYCTSSHTSDDAADSSGGSGY